VAAPLSIHFVLFRVKFVDHQVQKSRIHEVTRMEHEDEGSGTRQRSKSYDKTGRSYSTGLLEEVRWIHQSAE
jgi:hypothetical protein